MNLEPKKLERTFLNNGPMQLKASVYESINELVDIVIDLQKEVAELKRENKPMSAARAKRGK